MPTTEIVVLSLKAGTDLQSGDTQKVFQDILATILDQPGCEEINYGRQHESPDKLELAIDWTRYEDHMEFTKQPSYQPFLSRISTLIASPPQLYHANFRASSSPFSTVAQAPIVEMLLLYLPADVDEKATEKTLDGFIKTLAETAEGFVAIASGWVVEELEHENVEGKARGFQVAVGWASLEAHMKYRETEVFKENIPVVRGVAKGSAVHHTSFTKHSKV